MEMWIIIAVIVLILSIIKMPDKAKADSGEMTELRMRQHSRKAARRAARNRVRSLPWFTANRRYRKSKQNINW